MKSVPFYANTPDDMNCFPASFRMILKYFLPKQDFSWEELDKMSAHLPGMSTWPQAMMVELARMGFDIVMVDAFDGHAFIQEGAAYLQREFGGETAEWQIEHSNIPAEQEHYKRLYASDVKIEERIPDIDEIQNYLDRGYLVNCVVNSKRLNGKSGYTGHSVVIFEANDQQLTLHDPGLPPQPSRTVSLEDFEAAWANPNDKAKNIIALKLGV